MSAPSWESFLAEHFPGYLLPEALGHALSEEAAASFLERLGGHPEHLVLLREASVVAAHGDEIRALCLTELPDLSVCLTELPDLARRRLRPVETHRRTRVGELRGLLDVPATLRRRLTGRLDEVVSRTRRPPRLPPEDVVLGAVAARLSAILGRLHAAGVLGRAGWGRDLAACAEALDRLLATPVLAEAAVVPVTAVHEQAAAAAAHPAYALALGLHRTLRRALDLHDPERVARALAEGALLPLADHTRFELAVLVRLIQALAACPGWTLRRTLVVPGRSDIAELTGADGMRIAVHYDQAALDPGPYHAGLSHYLGQRGRLRPDITLVATAPGRARRAAVVEAKLSEDPGYLAEGYRETLVYLAEYGAALTGWPRAILVTSAGVEGEPRRGDAVIAVSWDRWVPEVVTQGLLAPLGLSPR